MHWEKLTRELVPETRQQVMAAARQQLEEMPASVLRNHTEIRMTAEKVLREVISRHPHAHTGPEQLADMVQALAASLGGMGFLEQLMPPVSEQYTDLVLNPDGSVWGREKGALQFAPIPGSRPSVQEAWQAIEALLSPLGRACSEASPSVDAKIPRDSDKGFAGARLKILHPVIAPGEGFPSLSLRFFERRPVTPEQIVAWGMLPATLIAELTQSVAERQNVMIIGGTGTGKTTLLSALCHGIPHEARIVKIEDPEEIWLPHPNVTTLEARPAPPGSSIPGYEVSHGVNDAMRMAPSHIIVGEVRTGTAALSLFRAFMSDHSGLTTFHANGPEEALARLGVILYADAAVPFEPGRNLFRQAIHRVVHIGFHEGRRKVLGVYAVNRGKGRQAVSFEPLWSHLDEDATAATAKAESGP